MPTDLTCPNAIKIFGDNLETCLRLIGSRPESLALRCNTNPQRISGFKQGLGVLSEQLLSAICNDIGIPRELILKEHRSPAEAVRQFEEAFCAKGKLTASNLIGSKETRGEETMPPQLQLPPGKLNDHAWRQNFGLNVRICLQYMEMTALSLATRAAFKEEDVHRIFSGKLSLSNDDIDAIRSEIGLNTNDLIMDYIDNNRRHDELLAKLKMAGRIKPPTAVAEVEPEPASSLVPEVPEPTIEVETEQEEPAIEPAVPAVVIPAETLETKETHAMINTNEVVWKDDDVTGKAGDHIFSLRDKEQRKIIGNEIKNLKDEKRPDDTWPDVLRKCKMQNKAANWLHNVSYGTAPITATEVETFAEFFDVTVLRILTGEGLDQPEEVADEDDSEEEAGALVPADSLPEPATQQSGTVASAEEARSGSGSAESPAIVEAIAELPFPNPEQDAQPSVAFQEHFKQRLLSADFHLADNVSPRSFLTATQAPEVDWCLIYYAMTDDGVETLKQVAAIAENLDSGDATLNADILTHVISMALKQK